MLSPRNMTLFTRWLPHAATGIAVAILLTGCTSTHIGITYTPQTNAAPVADAPHTPVNVDVKDVRMEKSVGTVYIDIGTGDGGSVAYTIFATNDVGTVVKQAI